MGRTSNKDKAEQLSSIELPFEEKYFKELKEKNIDMRFKGTWQKMYAYYLNLIFKYEGKNVLDLGCAMGSISSAFADRKTNVIGVDISKYAIDNSPHKNVKLINKAAWELTDIPDNSIDFVHSMYMFEYIPPEQREQVFAEINRVCKPEALVFVILNLGISKKGQDSLLHLSPKHEWDEIAAKFNMLDGARTYYYKLMETRVPGWEFMSVYHWPFLCYKVTKKVENATE